MSVDPVLIDLPEQPTVAAVLVGTVDLMTSVPSIALTPATPPVGWSIQGSDIILQQPAGQQLPVWYQFTIEVADGFSLVGIQIYSGENGHRATYFHAASGISTVVNLLYHMLPGNGQVHLGLAIGVLAPGSTVPQWIDDPTIIFDAPPQTGEL